jgi:hypothetical protein
MGIVLRILRWLWHRFGDFNNAVTLADLLDYKTAIIGALGTIAMMVYGALNYGWSPQAVLLAALAAGAFVSIIFIGLRVAYQLFRPNGALSYQPTIPLSPAQDLLSRVKAVADVTAGRLAYVRRALEQGNEHDLSRWVLKINKQRIDFDQVISNETANLTSDQATKLTQCHLLHKELDRCISDVIAGVGFESKRHATGQYLQRASKFSVALYALVEELENSSHAKTRPDVSSKSSVPHALGPDLYVSDIRFTFGELENDRHSELTIRVFNGTGHVVEVSNLSGRIKFNAPNSTDPSRMGELPTPALRPDTARTVAQSNEWFLILTQRVPAAEADKMLAMLKSDIPIHFDLSGLKIDIFAQDNRNNIEKLPLWHGVSYSRGNGFGRIISAAANIVIGSAVKIG